MSTLLATMDDVSMPALLRHARYVYGVAMRDALVAAGYDEMPKNGLYVIGGLAHHAGAHPLSKLIEDLRLSKQAAGQLVDTLVTQGYLQRDVDGDDRRKLTIGLTDKGRAAAQALTAARATIDKKLLARIGPADLLSARGALLALIDIGRTGISHVTSNGTLLERDPMEITETRKTLYVHDSDLTGSRFTDVKLESCSFHDVNMHGSNFTDANLIDARFVDVNLKGAAIEDANLTGMTINGLLVTDLLRAHDSRSKGAVCPTREYCRPFIPAKDFGTSKRFYERIGFAVEQVFSDGRGGILSLGASTFILQTFYVKEHAENYMMQLAVKDIDQWWRHIEAANLPESFGVPAPKAPVMQPWGIVVCYVVDPTGVLWHIIQATP